MSAPVLAFGASGKFAGQVVSALKERDACVRGFVKNKDDKGVARGNGADEVAFGDLTDPNSVAAALKGVERVFYIAPAFMPNEAEAGCKLVEACVEAGVRRVVFSSVIDPVLSRLSNHAAKAPVEEALIDSGLEYVLLHPALYFQNYGQSWKKVVDSGSVAEPWSCETRFSRVDFRDVAEVAAIAVTEDRLLYGTFELCAEGWLNRHDVATLMSEALGRDVTATKVDPATLGTDAKPMQPMFDHYDRVGLRGNSLTLTAILDHEPRTLAAYFAELARSGGSA